MSVQPSSTKVRRAIGKPQQRIAQVGGRDLAVSVASAYQLIDTRPIDVEGDDAVTCARERRRDRQSDISKADDGQFVIGFHRIFS